MPECAPESPRQTAGARSLNTLRRANTFLRRAAGVVFDIPNLLPPGRERVEMETYLAALHGGHSSLNDYRGTQFENVLKGLDDEFKKDMEFISRIARTDDK